MFWRIWLRSLTVKRRQAVLALVSLAVGAAVASMLLNMYGDVHRKMTEEFRAYGANIVLAPGSAGSNSGEELGGFVESGVLGRLDSLKGRIQGLTDAPVLYVLMRAAASPGRASSAGDTPTVVAVGTDFAALLRLNSGWRSPDSTGDLGPTDCVVGAHLANRLRVKRGNSLELSTFSAETPAAQEFRIAGVVNSGASEDDQVFVHLGALQRLARLQGKLSLVEVSVPGNAATVARAVRQISGALPGIDVRAIRQIVYSEGKVLSTIRWLLFSLTALILVIALLSVISTVTVILLERRRDIAVMKSLGASNRLVMRLLLTEVAALGLLGGVLGFGLGVLAARGLGARLFGVALHPEWWMLPLVCAACILSTVASSALPLGTVRSIDPAGVLKGE